MIDYVLFEGEKFNLGYNEIKKVEILKFIKEIKRQEIIIIEGGNENRKICETKKIDILLSPEKYRNKDFIHHRNSGLNQVLCELMRKNRVTYGINLSELINAKNRNELIGRINQNIKLCRKYKVRMMAASFAKNKFEMRNPNDILCLLKEIGMTPKEAKDSLEWKKSKEKGVELVE